MRSSLRSAFPYLAVGLTLTALLQAWMWTGRDEIEPRQLAVGDRLRSVEVEYGSVPLTLDFRSLPKCSFVLFLSPSCPTCERLAPDWAVDFADRTGRRGVAISLSGWTEAEEFTRSHTLPLPTLATGPDVPRIAHHLGVPSVPMMVVLGEKGRVAAVGWSRDPVEDLAAKAGCSSPSARR